ncbi:MAG: phospholipase D family protein [Moritella sp.]|nr:phospholipase D family protein [Moritella sp.]
MMSNSIYYSYKRIINPVLFSLLLSACSAKPILFPESKHDYCADIEKKSSPMLSTYLTPVTDKMANQTGVYVLEQGIEAMLSRAWLTKHAEETIDVQYFIFSTDNIGLIATDYLVKAADRGIKVRVLVDDIMVEANGEDLLTLSKHKNLSIKIYNPMVNIGKNVFDKVINLTTNFHQLNQRMHNKTFTVDGQVSITGGRNVADEYFGYDHEYNFRDRDVLLVGGAANDIQTSFDQFWESDLSVDVKELIKDHEQSTAVPNFTALHEYACNPENFVPSVRKKIKNIPFAIDEIQKNQELQWVTGVEYVSDIPGKNDQTDFLAGSGISTERLVELLRSAKTSVVIQTPYLITTKYTRSHFKALVDKGVEVKILTNSLASNDNLEAFSGYQRNRKDLLKTGVQIYEFKPDAQIRRKIMSEVMQKQLEHAPIFGLHAKTMVIDDNIAVIGTFNLDPRSTHLNTENFVVIPSKKMAEEVKFGMLEEMQPENAWRVTLDWNPDGEVSKLKQLGVKLRRVVPKNIL